MSLIIGIVRENHWIWESCIHHFSLLSQCILCDGLKGDINVDAFFSWCFEVWNIVFRLAPLLGSFSRNLEEQKKLSNIWIFADVSPTYSPILQIDFVSQNYERKMLRISRTRLDQELVTPWIEIFECVGCCCIENQNTTVCTSIESNTERLEAF